MNVDVKFIGIMSPEYSEALALRVIAERLEAHECRQMPINISLAYA